MEPVGQQPPDAAKAQNQAVHSKERPVQAAQRGLDRGLRRDGGVGHRQLLPLKIICQRQSAALRLQALGGLYLSPGYSNEVLHLYLARGLRQGACHPDEDEFVEGERIPFARLVDMVMADEIHDAKTVAAVLKAKVYLERT